MRCLGISSVSDSALKSLNMFPVTSENKGTQLHRQNGKHITASTTQPKENSLHKPDLVNALINKNEILGKHNYVLIRLKDLVSKQ